MNPFFATLGTSNAYIVYTTPKKKTLKIKAQKLPMPGALRCSCLPLCVFVFN